MDFDFVVKPLQKNYPHFLQTYSFPKKPQSRPKQLVQQLKQPSLLQLLHSQHNLNLSSKSYSPLQVKKPLKFAGWPLILPITISSAGAAMKTSFPPINPIFLYIVQTWTQNYI